MFDYPDMPLQDSERDRPLLRFDSPSVRDLGQKGFCRSHLLYRAFAFGWPNAIAEPVIDPASRPQTGTDKLMRYIVEAPVAFLARVQDNYNALLSLLPEEDDLPKDPPHLIVDPPRLSTIQQGHQTIHFERPASLPPRWTMPIDQIVRYYHDTRSLAYIFASSQHLPFVLLAAEKAAWDLFQTVFAEPGRQLYQTLQGQFQDYFQQLRPVPDAYRRYLPEASRVDRLPSYGGYGLLVVPVPLVSAEAGLTEQVHAAVQAAGPVWLGGADRSHCRTLSPAEDDYFVQQRTVPLDTEHRRHRSRWESHKEEYVEVRYAPQSARRSLHARRHLAKRDALSVTELCHLIDALADEARSAGHLTG